MIDERQLAAYRAARERAAFADTSAWGWVRLTGRDRLDLPHRLSTNALKHLEPGQGAPTVFTSATGRVMAFVTVYAGEGEALVRCMPGQAEGVARYLKSMIFWQDELEVGNLTPDASQFALYGPDAGTVLGSVAGSDFSDIEPYGWRAASVAGARATVHRGGELEAQRWLVCVASSAHTPVVEALAALMPRLDGEVVDLLRIEAGLPTWGCELSDQVTPLETGLLAAINFNKGCYTGQEVIARQTNYDKVTRNLVGLELDLFPGAPLLPRRESGVEAAVRGPGRSGFVSSVAFSPTLDRTIALAVVPRELALPGTEVEVVFEGQSLRAIVRSLPFVPKA